MLHPLSFYRFYRKNRFAEALASLCKETSVRFSDELWACYRLGLYHTVASTPLFKSKNWRGGFAWAVSLAACGRHEESKAQVHSWLNTGVCDEQKANLADCLVPFQPELAHEILQGIVAPATLRSAICLRVGQNELARKILADHLTSHSDTVNPEAWLYYSNASEALSSIDKLENLNRFLDAYQVPRLRMIDELCPPSPMNVQSAEDYPVVSGPLVTVLMTAYNSAARITSAIRSVITQSYRNIELIVIDDTSSDMTSDIVKTIMEDDKRVKFMSLPRNVGPYVAKNMGLLFAKGEFITCHDSDDWSHPLKIERQVTPLLKNRKLICTTSDWVRMQDDGTYYARPVHPLQRFNPSSPLFRRKEVLETIGAWDCVRTGADSEFIARLKLVFGRKAVLKIRQPLAFGSHRQGSLMTSPETGYSSTGISPLRLAYWESWTYWHIDQLRAGKKPRMPSLMEERAFSAPSGITVTPLHIARNLEEVEREYF